MIVPTSRNTKTITDMREDALKVLEDVEKQGLLYVFHHANPKAVMLSMEEFERLYELVEDHIDEEEAVRLSKEDRGSGIPLAKVAQKYHKAKR